MLIPYTKGGLTGTIAGIQDISFDFVDKSKQMFESVGKGIYSKTIEVVMSANRVVEKITGSSSTEVQDTDTNVPSIPLTESTTKQEEKTDMELLNPRGRIDYQLQESVLENAYISALGAQ